LRGARLKAYPVHKPFTLRGLYLMLRHGTGRLPIVIVDGELIHVDPVDNPRELAEKIRQALSGAGRSRRSPPRLWTAVP